MNQLLTPTPLDDEQALSPPPPVAEARLEARWAHASARAEQLLRERLRQRQQVRSPGPPCEVHGS